MNNQEKETIFSDIDSYFKKLLEKANSENFIKFINFTRRVPEHAPFNDALVFMQNPECFYYATANQWQKRFGRSIVENAKPEVILMPFRPVEFVYDVSQTEGDALPADFLYWWEESDKEISESILQNTIACCVRINIPVHRMGVDFTLEGFELRTMGTASRRLSDNARDIRLHPRYNDQKYCLEAFGVLCHEIAHHLLGHLGQIAVRIQNKENDKEVIVAKDRHNLSHSGKELEAEICAYLVFARMGIEKRSAEYLAGYAISSKGRSEFSASEVFKTADKIYKMGLGEMII